LTTTQALFAIIKGTSDGLIFFSVVFDNGEREKVKINRYFKIINTAKILTYMYQHPEFSSERERVHTEFTAIFKTCAGIFEHFMGLRTEQRNRVVVPVRQATQAPIGSLKV
jgi:hypothetical protein